MLPEHRISKTQATTELLFAAILWGFGFIATRWALDSFGPNWTSSLRFLITASCAIPFIFLSNSFWPYLTWSQLRLAAIPGVLIGLTLLTQCYGLQYTTVTKSGFITVLYVVFVPLFEWYLRGQRITFIHLINLIIALGGAALVGQLHGGDWNRGDVLTLVSAILAAVHILQLENLRDYIESAFVFNVLQSVWAGAVLLIPAYLSGESLPWPPTAFSLIGLAMISYGSTLVAFMIQVRSQQVLQPSLVSMLFLLESPFAAFFAYAIFGEHLTYWQWLGAFLILLAAFNQVRAWEN